MPRIGALAVSLLLVAVPALAACGEDTDEQNDYVDEVNEVTTTLNTELDRIAGEVTSIGSPEDAADAFVSFGESIQRASDEISEIEPPGEVTELHDRLASEISELGAEAERVADEVREGGAAAVIGVATRFIAEANRIGGDIDATLDEINSILQD